MGRRGRGKGRGRGRKDPSRRRKQEKHKKKRGGTPPLPGARLISGVSRPKVRNKAFLERLDVAKAESLEVLDALSRRATVVELAYFLDATQVVRVLDAHTDDFVQRLQLHRSYDVMAYLALCVAKHAPKPNPDDAGIPDIEITQPLIQIGLHLHKLWEVASLDPMGSFEQLDDDVKPKLVLELPRDEWTRKLSAYGRRLERHNEVPRTELMSGDTLLESARSEFSHASDLLESGHGITVDELIEVCRFLLETVSARLEEAEDASPTLPNGNVDLRSALGIRLRSEALTLGPQILGSGAPPKLAEVVSLLEFDPEPFDPADLRVDVSRRTPLIRAGDNLLLSPAVLGSALHTAPHYILLRGPERNRYKLTREGLHLDSIAAAAEHAGFREVVRNLELGSNEEPLGDVDLVLANNDGDALAIEGKNWSLPLDVFSKSPSAVHDRLTKTLDWEYKTERREQYLRDHSSLIGDPKSLTYLIVSREPEILSHFSKRLVLTLREFERWLEDGRQASCFDALLSRIEADDVEMTEDDLGKLGPFYGLDLDPPK